MAASKAQMIPSIRAFIQHLPSIDFTAAELSGPKITISLTSRSFLERKPLRQQRSLAYQRWPNVACKPLIHALWGHSLGRRREEAIGVHGRRIGADRQLIGSYHRVDGLLQFLRSDRAEAILHHVLRIGQPQRNIEAHLLDVELHHWIVRLKKLQGFLQGCDRVLGSLI